MIKKWTEEKRLFDTIVGYTIFYTLGANALAVILMPVAIFFGMDLDTATSLASLTMIPWCVLAFGAIVAFIITNILDIVRYFAAQR